MATLRKSVKDGDRRQALFAIADLLVATLEQAEPRDVSSLARQLRETLKDIASLPQDAEKDLVDELLERRTARIAGAKNQGEGPSPAKRGSRRGEAG